MRDSKIIIGITGKIATGKSLISRYLNEKGFEVIDVGDFLKNLTYELYNTKERNKIEYISKTLEKMFPNFSGWFMISKILASNNNKIVIDSIREPDEINLLKKFFKIKVICLDCEDEKRIERILKRASEKDPKTRDKIIEMFEKTPSEKSVDEIIENGMFDLYIDTTNLNKEQVMEIVEKFVESK